MNKLITLLFLLGIGVSAVFVGCKKSITSNNTYSMNAIKGKLGTNSETYTAPNCLAILYGTTMVIEGLSGPEPFPTYPYIALSIPNWYGAVREFDMDSILGSVNGRYFTAPNTYNISAYGKLYINSVSDELITGKFYFTTKDTTVIEQGNFTAKIHK